MDSEMAMGLVKVMGLAMVKDWGMDSVMDLAMVKDWGTDSVMVTATDSASVLLSIPAARTRRSKKTVRYSESYQQLTGRLSRQSPDFHCQCWSRHHRRSRCERDQTARSFAALLGARTFLSASVRQHAPLFALRAHQGCPRSQQCVARSDWRNPRLCLRTKARGRSLRKAFACT
jgi:hypothetical protein